MNRKHLNKYIPLELSENSSFRVCPNCSNLLEESSMSQIGSPLWKNCAALKCFECNLGGVIDEMGSLIYVSTTDTPVQFKHFTIDTNSNISEIDLRTFKPQKSDTMCSDPEHQRIAATDNLRRLNSQIIKAQTRLKETEQLYLRMNKAFSVLAVSTMIAWLIFIIVYVATSGMNANWNMLGIIGVSVSLFFLGITLTIRSWYRKKLKRLKI